MYSHEFLTLLDPCNVHNYTRRICFHWDDPFSWVFPWWCRENEKKVKQWRIKLKRSTSRVEIEMLGLKCNETNGKQHLLEVCKSTTKWLYLPSSKGWLCGGEACVCMGRQYVLCSVDNHDISNMLLGKELGLDIHLSRPRKSSSRESRIWCEFHLQYTRCTPIAFSDGQQSALDYGSIRLACSYGFCCVIPSRWFDATSQDWPASTVNTLRSELIRK